MISKRPGADLCLRRHAETGAECCLTDSHYPRPHRDINGSIWHDGLCPECHGGGTVLDTVVCPSCNGVGFALLELHED